MKHSMVTDVFKIIIAFFVLYNGIELLKGVADRSQPDPVIDAVMGIVFVLIGAGFLIFSFRKKILEYRER